MGKDSTEDEVERFRRIEREYLSAGSAGCWTDVELWTAEEDFKFLLYCASKLLEIKHLKHKRLYCTRCSARVPLVSALVDPKTFLCEPCRSPVVGKGYAW